MAILPVSLSHDTIPPTSDTATASMLRSLRGSCGTEGTK
jgi:hypothetical protein